MKKPSVYYLIFALSGFSGLIYESIWTHYLKLFLGHAAYAQTLVLAIFMGGMALGAYGCSRYSGRWQNLLAGYALVEGIVGLCALAYHPLFDTATAYAFASIIPALDSPTTVHLFKWGLSTLSILPQSILLGMTFPLMSGAFLRLFPERSGRSLALLYFANSSGAVFGVLASGFVFIDLLGFPGTIGLAGIINIALGIAVWLMACRPDTVPAADSRPAPAAATGAVPARYRLLLLISLGTGVASFIYEISWIRLLALVLGSSTHAFELMLSAFLLGLAGGGLWVKQRIDGLDRPLRFLAGVQLTMGLAALATLPLYNGTFPLMQWLMTTLPKTAAGYLLFNLCSYGIAAAIMLPATFCAGMTLPLITNILFRAGHGEKSIGAVYAANTVGAIIGIFAAVHLIMPALGLKGLLISGASLDLALAVLLVLGAADLATRRLTLPFAVGCSAAVLLAIFLVQLDQYKMASGVYRAGVRLLSPENVALLFHRDGKTATISVARATSGVTNIITNGKSDSAININPTGPAALDEATTILSGALPFFYNPAARRIANIGLGTGLTSQTVLSSPRVEQVDTIEIEPAVIVGAQQFRSRTDLVYSDPRSRLIIDDAKSVFSSNGRIYDVIISEPSNPWVSGVAGLFSDEFYRHVRRHLQDDGLFVQWIQLYESDMDVVASVFKALAKNFDDYSVYLTGGNADLMVVAKKRGVLGPLNPAPFQYPQLQALLARINVNGLQDVRIRALGSKKFLDPLFQSYPIKANSDYFPVLDQRVGKTKFMDTGAFPILQLAGGKIPYLPYLQLISSEGGMPTLSNTAVGGDCGMTLLARRGASLRQFIISGQFPADAAADENIIPAEFRTAAGELRAMLANGSAVSEEVRRELVSSSAIAMLPYLTDAELQPVWAAFERPACRRAMTPGELQLLDFFKALGRKDFTRVAALAGQLLTEERRLTPDQRQYITAAGMLASLANGDRSGARSLYQQVFGSRKQTDIVLRLLNAHSSI